jgi:hypothetical protein
MALFTDANPVEDVAQQAVEPEQESQDAQGQDSDQSESRNWRQARQRMEEQQKTIQLMKDRERLYEQRLRELQPKQAEEEEIDPDGVVSASQVKKLAAKEFQRLLREHENAKGEDVARAKFKDYDSVVNAESLERLGREDPDALEAIANHPNKKGQAIAAYYTISALAGRDPERATAARVRENAAKPRASGSMGASSALQSAGLYEGRLTGEKKQQAYREMMEAIKNR